MIVIVSSEKDPASKNMKEILLDKVGSKEIGAFEENPVYKLNIGAILVTTKKDTIYCDEVFENFEGGFYIILSRHSSKEKIPTITTHVTGNFGEALFGGEPRKLSIAAPIFMKNFLLKAKEIAPEKYDIKQEVTHHGPTPDKKLAFVEVGSSEEEWNDLEACECVVESLLYALKRMNEKCDVAVGFGGPHYSFFTKYVFERGIAFGHILPKYAQEHISKEIVDQMIEKNDPKPNLIYINKKGLSSEYRKKLLEILQDYDLEVIKV